MESQREYLKGRVLDFGAGKPGTCLQPEPYRDLVNGEYVPIDKGDAMPRGLFDAVICTQVIQYPEVAQRSLNVNAFACLRDGGSLLMTYPTSWPDGDPLDFWRFTKAGMEWLLENAGLTILTHDLRAVVRVGNFSFPLGYGVVAQK